MGDFGVAIIIFTVIVKFALGQSQKPATSVKIDAKTPAWTSQN